MAVRAIRGYRTTKNSVPECQPRGEGEQIRCIMGPRAALFVLTIAHPKKEIITLQKMEKLGMNTIGPAYYDR